MKCEDICYDLCAYLDGQLDPEKLEAVKEHLRSCPRCRQEFSIQRCIKMLLRERLLARVAAPDSLRNAVITDLERADEYRDSGIQALDLIPWGTHIASLCKDGDELIDLLVPYLETGLAHDELCVWITSAIPQEEAVEALSKRVPRLQNYIDTGQLQFFTHEEWFLPGGYFDKYHVLKKGVRKYCEALCRGYAGLRITGSLFWLDPSIWDSFMEYENSLGSFIREHKALVICIYKESDYTIDNIDDVANSHEYVISKASGSWRLREVSVSSS